MFGTVLQKLLRLENCVLLTGRLFHILITRLLKKERMTELEHRCLLSVYGCPRSCDCTLGLKKASLDAHSQRLLLVQILLFWLLPENYYINYCRGTLSLTASLAVVYCLLCCYYIRVQTFVQCANMARCRS